MWRTASRLLLRLSGQTDVEIAEAEQIWEESEIVCRYLETESHFTSLAMKIARVDTGT